MWIPPVLDVIRDVILYGPLLPGRPQREYERLAPGDIRSWEEDAARVDLSGEIRSLNETMIEPGSVLVTQLVLAQAPGVAVPWSVDDAALLFECVTTAHRPGTNRQRALPVWGEFRCTDGRVGSPGVEPVEGEILLHRLRVWRNGDPNPRIILIRRRIIPSVSGDLRDGISLQGLESSSLEVATRFLSAALPLLVAVGRPVGRPPGLSRAAVASVEAAEALKRRDPKRSWVSCAAEVGLSESTLHYRRRLLRQGNSSV